MTWGRNDRSPSGVLLPSTNQGNGKKNKSNSRFSLSILRGDCVHKTFSVTLNLPNVFNTFLFTKAQCQSWQSVL